MTRGRPRTFDRDAAVLEAARLFWRHGYSGTSTRALTAALGLSPSSLYAAFDSKAGLFEEAVRTYAERYREIYAEAVTAPDLASVLERVLRGSAEEFTQPPAEHPGCLVSSAVLADSPDTLDVRAQVDALHDDLVTMLRQRFATAIDDGELPAGTDPAAAAALVQALWHGLSVESGRGASRERLLATADLGRRVLLRGLGA